MAIALTTVDNPFNPINEFDSWKRFDEDNEYYSCELLARFARTYSAMSEREYEIEIEKAMNKIVDMFDGFYLIVNDE